MTDRLDVAIIGGGIVGLATALRLQEARPALRLGVIEQEPELAVHQSGHNSGVIHAGLYYTPGSLKARLCREGKAELEAYCRARSIPIRTTGKLVVALSDADGPRLAALAERATANAVPGLERIGRERMRELEPYVAGVAGLWSPTTAIVDFRQVALSYADDVRAAGGTIWTGRRVTSIDPRHGEVILGTTGGDVVAGRVVACAGLWADRVAAMSGDQDPGAPRIVPFRGDYYTLVPEARALVRGLIYPLADPRFPFLGVHFTRRIDGAVWAGPNAVLAFKRTGYRRRDLSVADLAGTFAYPGFLRLARRYFSTGIQEMWRDAWKPAFVAELRRYLPELRADQLVFGPSGVRAQALDRRGVLVDDFDLGGSSRILHVRNAPSPAATASLAIGRELATRAIERFEL